ELCHADIHRSPTSRPSRGPTTPALSGRSTPAFTKLPTCFTCPTQLRRGPCWTCPTRFGGRLKMRLDAELDQLARRLWEHLRQRRDDFNRSLEVPGAFQGGDEIRQAGQRGAAAVEHDVGADLFHLRQPQHPGQRATDLIQQVNRTRLISFQLLDQRDPLLELRLALLELLHLQDDGVETCRFLLRGGDRRVEG